MVLMGSVSIATLSTDCEHRPFSGASKTVDFGLFQNGLYRGIDA